MGGSATARFDLPRALVPNAGAESVASAHKGGESTVQQPDGDEPALATRSRIRSRSALGGTARYSPQLYRGTSARSREIFFGGVWLEMGCQRSCSGFEGFCAARRWGRCDTVAQRRLALRPRPVHTCLDRCDPASPEDPTVRRYVGHVIGEER
ncbi:hypothetical protein T484DRAFT_1884816 [Baffinella frigidus]|nr:hypothetical protein T484DRAFT_1884816 [Cryptophyta sp. CCMP2293]